MVSTNGLVYQINGYNIDIYELAIAFKVSKISTSRFIIFGICKYLRPVYLLNESDVIVLTNVMDTYLEESWPYNIIRPPTTNLRWISSIS